MTERALDEVLAELNQLQLRYVVARVTARFDKDAAKQVGVHPSSVAKWKMDGVPVDEAVRLLSVSALLSAKTTLEAHAQFAAEALVNEVVERGDERIRAALAILDRVGLPASSRIEADLETSGVMIVLDDGTES
jgi:hypothetical protein